MSQWIKLHTCILRDTRIGKLPWRDRGIWLMLLALAGELEDRDAAGQLTGRLDTLEGVAWHLHTRPDRIAPSIQHLLQLGLLHQDADGVLFIVDFAAQQAADTPAERMQRYRQRSRSAPPPPDRVIGVTPPPPARDADETPPLRARDADVTPPLRARDDGVTHALRHRYAPVTHALRDVAESEQNRIRTEQQPESEQQQQQNRTDTEPPLFAAAVVDNSVDMSLVAVDNSVGMARTAGEPVAAAVDNSVGMARTAGEPVAAAELPERADDADEWAAADASAEVDDEPEAWPAEARASPRHEASVPTDADRTAAVQAHVWATAAAWDANRVQAREQLLALGVEAATAEHLARHHHPERILAWCAYARRQTGLHNPAGFVIQRIMRGLAPPAEAPPQPKRWYTDEEYERFFAV